MKNVDLLMQEFCPGGCVQEESIPFTLKDFFQETGRVLGEVNIHNQKEVQAVIFRFELFEKLAHECLVEEARYKISDDTGIRMTGEYLKLFSLSLAGLKKHEGRDFGAAAHWLFHCNLCAHSVMESLSRYYCTEYITVNSDSITENRYCQP